MNEQLAKIHAAIPHRPPFLLVDEIVSQTEKQIVCRKKFTGDEWFFAGHYPNQPIVPGVLLCEAALQAGAILLAGDKSDVRSTEVSDSSDASAKNSVPVVTRINEVRFKHIVRPGDTIEIEVELREKMAQAFFFDGKVSCGGKSAVRLEFACMLAEV